jgi:outer membrane receptor protein involved in Fe transport
VVAVLLVGSGVAAAEPVHGRVTDARGHAVAGAVVTIEGATSGVVTNDRGEYVLDAVPDASLIVSAHGYAIGLASAAATDVVLIAEETIEVHGDPPPSAMGAAHLERSEVERLPGGGNDLMRSLTAMPGIVDYPLPLGSSSVVIRGSSPQDSKVLVDDFEVPTLYHDVGFRSIIPVEAIDSLEYVPGGFDVSYGRATSGVVELTTRAGGDVPHEQAELGAGEMSALAQGTEHGLRYMASVRRSTMDLYLPYVLPSSLDLSLTTLPRYYDEQVRLDYAVNSKWTLRLSSLGSDDALELYASRDRNADKRYLNEMRFVRATAAATYHDGGTTAKLAVSGITLDSRFERGIYQHMGQASPSLTARGEVLHTAKDSLGFADLAWRAGAETVVTDHTLDIAMPRQPVEGEPPSSIDDPMDTSVTYNGAFTTTNHAAWTSATAGLDDRVRLTGGLRVDQFSRAGETLVEPRGELQIGITRGVIARFSAGAYSRPPEYQTELLAMLHAERSRQMIAGLQLDPAEGLRVQTSLYYTDRDQLITRDAMTGELSNAGRGTTYGAELLGTYNRGPWFAWLTYSYSHSTRIDAPGLEARLFDYDVPHSLNVAGSYRHGRFQFGARFRLQSGLPATPVDGAIFDSDANLYYPTFGAVNSVRAPMHHQLDIRIDRWFHLGAARMTQFLDIQNVYMNETAVGYFYGFDYTQRAAFRQLPILPTVGLRGEF